MPKILIVDDEEPNRSALERIFQRERAERRKA
jgi:PleD family two-component response regulator